jgi:hypothetical protein
MTNDKLSNYAQMLMPFLFLLRCCYVSGFKKRKKGEEKIIKKFVLKILIG